MKFNKKYIEDYWFPVEDVLDKFKDIRIFYRNIRIGIKNLIIWFPTIWKDRYWDNTFLYEILRFKLSDMEKNIRKNGLHLRAEQDAGNIRLCVLLLDRLMDDDYLSNSLKYHDRKWGEGDWKFTPVEGNSELSSIEIIRKQANTPEEKRQEQKEWKVCMTRSDNSVVQDLELLFKTMRKHIRSWWD